jgi:uncharacterized phage-associated protein
MKENKKPQYLPAHIANYFLWRAWGENIQITPMKLIRLIYIAYGWNLAINNKKLFQEDIQDGKHGPLIASIYHEFKRFGNQPISKDNYAADFNIETGELLSVPIVPSDDYDTLKVLNAEWEIYKHKNSQELQTITKKTANLSNKELKERSLDAITTIIKKAGLDKYA